MLMSTFEFYTDGRDDRGRCKFSKDHVITKTALGMYAFSGVSSNKVFINKPIDYKLSLINLSLEMSL